MRRLNRSFAATWKFLKRHTGYDLLMVVLMHASMIDTHTTSTLEWVCYGLFVLMGLFLISIPQPIFDGLCRQAVIHSTRPVKTLHERNTRSLKKQNAACAFGFASLLWMFVGKPIEALMLLVAGIGMWRESLGCHAACRNVLLDVASHLVPSGCDWQQVLSDMAEGEARMMGDREHVAREQKGASNAEG